MSFSKERMHLNKFNSTEPIPDLIMPMIMDERSNSIFIESDLFAITVILQRNGQGIQMLFQALARY